MITVADINAVGLTYYKEIVLDEEEGLISHTYKDIEDINPVIIDVDYECGKQCGVDVIVPAFVLRNPTKERLDDIMDILSVKEGEVLTILS